jgi:hypothetical protein
MSFADLERSCARSPIQQQTALAGSSVWRRIIAQMRDIASPPGKQKLAAKNARNADSAALFCLSRQKRSNLDAELARDSGVAGLVVGDQAPLLAGAMDSMETLPSDSG